METATINFINIGLMLVSAVLAFVIPFELFLFSYAVLGPLHYLTEISWLYDRRFFAKRGRWGAPVLILLSAAITLTVVIPLVAPSISPISASDEIVATISALLVCLGLLVAAMMIFPNRRSWWFFLAICGLLSVTLVVSFGKVALVFALLVPTLVHVFLFTGIFILSGALKSKDYSGLLSLIAFITCAAVCIFWRGTATTYSVTHFIRENTRLFLPIYDYLRSLFQVEKSWESMLAFMRFMAFAYTYHYLNWFSKTRIIQWHKVSRVRAATILALYLISVGVYLYNYTLGIFVLFYLSMTHVLLEFPLNIQSIIGVSSARGSNHSEDTVH